MKTWALKALDLQQKAYVNEEEEEEENHHLQYVSKAK